MSPVAVTWAQDAPTTPTSTSTSTSTPTPTPTPTSTSTSTPTSTPTPTPSSLPPLPPVTVTVTPLPPPPAIPEPPPPGTALPDLEDLPPPPPARPPPSPRWSVGVNPLAFLFGRIGGDAEYYAGSHVAFVGNVHFDSSAALSNTNTDPYWGFGGELGVRYYHVESLYGLFAGPSVVGGAYYVSYYGYSYPLPDVGLAFDVGGKARIGENGFIAVGAGVQHLWSRPYPNDFPAIIGTIIGGGGWPVRLLLTFGVTFR